MREEKKPKKMKKQKVRKRKGLRETPTVLYLGLVLFQTLNENKPQRV